MTGKKTEVQIVWDVKDEGTLFVKRVGEIVLGVVAYLYRWFNVPFTLLHVLDGLVIAAASGVTGHFAN